MRKKVRVVTAHLGGVGGVHHLVLQGAAEHRVVPDDSSRSQLLHRGSLLEQLGQVNTSSALSPLITQLLLIHIREAGRNQIKDCTGNRYQN